MKIVAASGYFNPIHIGHIEYLEESKKLGDILIVIVNNDYQVELKGAAKFMPAGQRARIIRALRCVDEVTIAIDTTLSVAETLRIFKPNIFANGGDRKDDQDGQNVIESRVCKEINCKMVYGVGGTNKYQSSSALIKKAHDQYRYLCWVKGIPL